MVIAPWGNDITAGIQKDHSIDIVPMVLKAHCSLHKQAVSMAIALSRAYSWLTVLPVGL